MLHRLLSQHDIISLLDFIETTGPDFYFNLRPGWNRNLPTLNLQGFIIGKLKLSSLPDNLKPYRDLLLNGKSGMWRKDDSAFFKYHAVVVYIYPNNCPMLFMHIYLEPIL